MRKTKAVVLAIIAAAALLAGSAAYEMTRSKPARSLAQLHAADPDAGRRQFAFGDMGALDLDTLETTAMPWRLITAAVALLEAGGDSRGATQALADQALRRVGFLFPAAVGNGPALPPMPGPLGLSVGVVERTVPPLRVAVANLGCAACHAGTSYDGEGRPRPDLAWLGMPNTSLDLEAYTQLVYRALKAGFADERSLLETVARLYPDMEWRERATLRYLVIPKAKARIEALAQSGDRPLPFPNGAPGLTNGVAALKMSLRLPPAASPGLGPGFVSIPDLGAVAFRSALLADGAYVERGRPRFAPVSAGEAARRDPASIARLASFFTVPSMGLTPARAEGAVAPLTQAVAFIAAYQPQRFPGRVDRALAADGRTVYARACASCHGSYDGDLDRPRLLSLPNWHGDVGTDRSRAAAFTPELAAAVQAGPYAAHMDTAATGGYLAPPLAGVWASAPYFVNGSVPTLRHLLEPGTRPGRFQVGGHALDFERVGVALVEGPDGIWRYPPGYAPFADPYIVDTGRPGFSNGGHEDQVEGLTARERDALIEYLKLL